MAAFTSKINGNDIYAKRAERTRSGLPFESIDTEAGILPEGLASATGDARILATKKYVQDQMGSVAEAMLYKGAVDGTSKVLPTTGYKAGWTYKVAVEGTYAGKECEVGDMIIANTDYASGTASNVDWDVIQTNIDGAVINTDTAVVDGHIPMFSGTSGKIIIDGIDPNSLKTKQTAVSVTGGTLKGVASFSQDANGEATLTLNDIQDGTTEQKGVVQLQGTVGASETENAKAATPKAVRDAITGAVAALDATITGAAASKTLATLTETDGVIAATFQDIQIGESQVNNLTDDLAAKANKSEMSVVAGTGTDADKTTITLKTGTSATVLTAHQDITGKADKVSGATSGNFAGLDANGNLTDSGSKAADFATAAQGAKADSAIQGVTVNGTALTPDSSKVVDITVPTQATAGSNTPGTVTYETVDLD